MDFIIQKAYAQTVGNPTGNGPTSFNTLYNNLLSGIVNPLIYLLFALAVVYFIWGVIVFIRNSDNSDKRKEGFDHMMWGLVGIFIMISAKGIINLILVTFGLK